VNEKILEISSMRLFARCFLLFLFTLSSSAVADEKCGFIAHHLGVCAALKVADAKVSELNESITSSANMLSKSIPGERYHRLWETLTGPDSKEKRETLALIERLADTPFGQRWEVTLNFDLTDEKSEVLYDVFFTPIINKEFIQRRVSAETYSASYVVARDNFNPTLPEEQARSVIEDRVREALDLMTGTGLVVLSNRVSGKARASNGPLVDFPAKVDDSGRPVSLTASLIWPGSLFPTDAIEGFSGLDNIAAFNANPHIVAKVEAVKSNQNRLKDKIAQVLTSAIDLQYGLHAQRNETESRTVPWDPIKNRTINILIPRSHIERFSNDRNNKLVVRITFHKKGDPKTLYPGSTEITISEKEFAKNIPERPDFADFHMRGEKIAWWSRKLSFQNEDIGQIVELKEVSDRLRQLMKY
jgi:hypothetical protein